MTLKCVLKNVPFDCWGVKNVIFKKIAVIMIVIVELAIKILEYCIPLIQKKYKNKKYNE